VCTDQGEGFQWTVVSSPHPLSNRWLTYGPELQLHGPGMRNPESVTGEPGKPLEFSVAPTLFTIKLSGNRLWQKV
jgi:hypothetical protein